MSRQLLLVDDDPINNLVNKKQIERYDANIKVFVFQEAKIALDFLETSNPSIPLLVLLDINMPQVDGWDFLEFIRGGYNHVEVVMLTSSIDEKDRQKASTYSHLRGYVIKPLTQEKAVEILS